MEHLQKKTRADFFWSQLLMHMHIADADGPLTQLFQVCVCLCAYLCDTADKITNESLYPCVCPTPFYREKKNTAASRQEVMSLVSQGQFATPPKSVFLSPSQSFPCQGPSLWPVTPSAEVNAHSSCCTPSILHTRSHPCSSWTWTCPAAAHTVTQMVQGVLYTCRLWTAAHIRVTHICK